MGERLDLSAPHAGERWWRNVDEHIGDGVDQRVQRLLSRES
jgi:hypothetical protein